MVSRGGVGPVSWGENKRHSLIVPVILYTTRNIPMSIVSTFGKFRDGSKIVGFDHIADPRDLLPN